MIWDWSFIFRGDLMDDFQALGIPNKTPIRYIMGMRKLDSDETSFLKDFCFKFYFKFIVSTSTRYFTRMAGHE